MLLTCNNKGCMQSSDAKLDTKTNEVLCEACGKDISNITEFMKKNLKTQGQIVRSTDKKAFMVACLKCASNREVVFDEDEKTICKVCKNEVNVSKPMKIAMKSYGNIANLAPEEAEAPTPKAPSKVRPKIKTKK